MIQRRLSKRIAVGVATLMLLLCQGVALADACKTVAPRADTTEVQAPCHAPAQSGGAMDDGFCNSRCPSQFATVEPSKLNITIADLPVTVAWNVPPVAAESFRIVRSFPPDPAPPPPITRLYCRMLS